MKHIILLLIAIISTSVFAQKEVLTRDDYMRIFGKPNQEVFVFHIKTTWRTEVESSTMEGSPYKANSDMYWFINKSNGMGVMLDETPTITSVYELRGMGINYLDCRECEETEMFISGIARSDIGNDYTVTINDRSRFLTFIGPGIDYTVMRLYTVVDGNNLTSQEVLSNLLEALDE